MLNPEALFAHQPVCNEACSHPAQLLPHLFSDQPKFVKHIVGNDARINGIIWQ